MGDQGSQYGQPEAHWFLKQKIRLFQSLESYVCKQ